jgi:hypothetical protein
LTHPHDWNARKTSGKANTNHLIHAQTKEPPKHAHDKLENRVLSYSDEFAKNNLTVSIKDDPIGYGWSHPKIHVHRSNPSAGIE